MTVPIKTVRITLSVNCAKTDEPIESWFQVQTVWKPCTIWRCTLAPPIDLFPLCDVMIRARRRCRLALNYIDHYSTTRVFHKAENRPLLLLTTFSARSYSPFSPKRLTSVNQAGKFSTCCCAMFACVVYILNRTQYISFRKWCADSIIKSEIRFERRM